MVEKSEYTHNIFSKIIYCPISNYIAKKIININITPNQITFLGFLVVCMGALFFGLNMPILGVILLQISIIGDHLDGTLARIKNMGTNKGAFFDPILDRLGQILIYLSICYNQGSLAIILAYLCIASWLLYSYMVAHSNNIFKEDKKINLQKNMMEGLAGKLRISYIYLNIGYGKELLLSIGAISNAYLIPALLIIALNNLLTLFVFLIRYNNEILN